MEEIVPFGTLLLCSKFQHDRFKCHLVNLIFGCNGEPSFVDVSFLGEPGLRHFVARILDLLGFLMPPIKRGSRNFTLLSANEC